MSLGNVNRGKQFENVIKEAFQKVSNVSVDRLHDQTTGYLGSANICDFIVYKKPYEYYIECKTIHGNTLPLGNITHNQWSGLTEKSKIDGVRAGVIIWFVDKDITMFVPIGTLQLLQNNGYNSVHYTLNGLPMVHLTGKKKRVFTEYDMREFFKAVDLLYETDFTMQRIKESLNELQTKYRRNKKSDGDKAES